MTEETKDNLQVEDKENLQVKTKENDSNKKKLSKKKKILIGGWNLFCYHRNLIDNRLFPEFGYRR